MNIDALPPLITMTLPAETNTYLTTLIPFQWSATDLRSGLKENILQIDRDQDGISDTNIPFSFSTVSTSFLLSDPSTNRWRVIASDLAGNTKTNSWSVFRIVTTLPIVTIHSPHSGTNITDSQIITFSWSDKSVTTNILQISTNAGFSVNFLSTNLGSATNFINSAWPLPDDTWHVRIVTVSGGVSYSSTPITFIISYVVPPPVPGMIGTDTSDTRIYPNPLYYDETLKIDRLPSNAKIGIYTMKGIQIWEREVKNYDGTPISEWKDTGIASGIYLVVITSDSGKKSVKKLLYIKDRRTQE